jgi:hypothetical protein
MKRQKKSIQERGSGHPAAHATTRSKQEKKAPPRSEFRGRDSQK